ncbi:hypothetical protein ACH50O_14100 [Methylomonas sp. 2BW1-5-20]|uniref:hypothetical protein n=1 Tax=Methylomonas sp. 2BW1-5-20 TaxID=3376686 RepID=UPI00404F747B
MKLETQFSNSQLKRINVQAMLYMCSCPSQVSAQIDSLRRLFDYQANCSERSRGEVQTQVHRRIADATQKAHLIMEQCLKDVLDLEGWDPETLEMPAGLRALLEQELDDE